MLDARAIYDVYKEYAWREYDLLEKRANWIYVGNTVFAAGLGIIIQNQFLVGTQAASALKAIHDPYLLLLYSAARYAILLVPLVAVAFNFGIWNMMLGAVRTIENLRLAWRDIRDDESGDNKALPYLTFGLHDCGAKAVGIVSTSLVPIGLILFWASVAALGASVLIFRVDLTRWFM